MVVPYGFGVGDVIAVGTIAWNVYKACRTAPESFSNISLEVLSLHAVLKEAEETLFKSPLPTESQKRLTTVGDGCRSVLDDLQKLVDRYESLGTQSKRTWDRMKWGAQDIAEIRQRLISNTTMLTAFISTSQPSVEQKLDKLLRDVRDGRREPSIASRQTVDSLTPDDKEIWRAIRKELEDIGITIAAFDANKDFIFSWFTNAVESGAFQEEEPPSPSESTCSSGTHSPVISSSSFKVDELDTPDVSGGIGPLDPAEKQHKDVEPAASKQTAAASNSTRHISRIAILIATLSRPKRRFSAAVRAGDNLEVKRILKDPTYRLTLNDHTLYTELGNAIRFGYKYLIKPMIDAGAPVNQINADTGHNESSPLIIAVESGDQWTVGYLLENGADVNHDSKAGHGESSPLMIAVKGRDQSIVRCLLENGADVNHDSKAGHGESSPLMIAVKGRDQSIVRCLLENGADVNHNADTGMSDFNALRCAIKIKSESMVSLLLAYGADVNAKRSPGDDCVAIHRALEKGSIPIMGMLLEHGADIDSNCATHGTPVVTAVDIGNVQALRFLVRKGADVNRSSDYGILFAISPLELATRKDSLEMVRILVEYGAELGLQAALRYARVTTALSNHIEIKRLLKQEMSRLQLIEY